MPSASASLSIEHRTFCRPFVLLLEDRGPRALRRTLKRMGYHERQVPHKLMRDDLPPGQPGLAIKCAVEDIQRETGEMPQIVLFEGLDMAVKEAGKMDTAAAALKQIQAVCAYYRQ